MFDYEFRFPQDFDRTKDKKLIDILSQYPLHQSIEKVTDEFMKYLETCTDSLEKKQIFMKMFELLYFQIDVLSNENETLQSCILGLQKLLETYTETEKGYDSLEKRLDKIDEIFNLYLIEKIDSKLEARGKSIRKRCRKTMDEIETRIKELEEEEKKLS